MGRPTPSALLNSAIDRRLRLCMQAGPDAKPQAEERGDSAEEFLDWLALGDETRNIIGNTAQQPYLADVEQRVHDRRGQVPDRVRLRGGPPAIATGLADHLPHPQPAAVEEQRRQVAPVIAAAALVDARRATHLAGRDEQD